MAIYRSVARDRMDTKEGRGVSYERLGVLLAHLESFDITLVALTISAGELQVEVSGDIPARQASHLGLEKVA